MTVSTQSRPIRPAKQRRVLPGFGLTMGFTLLYLSLLVLIPLSMLFWKTSSMPISKIWSTVTDDRVLQAFKLTFGASFCAALFNVFFGGLVAWVLARYRFPGKRLIDGLVDLPFALPTAVAGICLVTVYSQNGWIGRIVEPHGLKIAFTPIGITVALIFIGLPFVVRTVQPVLEDMEAELEEAAASLGATRLQTFLRVLAPPLAPVMLTGFTLAFARALGEYGSVVFIAGNRPYKTEILPLLIITKLEEYNYAGATAIALVMLISSFALLLAINVLQAWSRKRQGTV
ncbi:sulfate ABC transporter permease subunit CysT [Capsulimonas corticalis]|uniref:sulfate ABC transporter permease subunit CysT n=1 Tax=Capsulimonas corticalis TaxID=2219043 RepID=UPI000E65398C|nr:sulfate ABC transporter permease subunit CysT [Capsulimonas corticalis]